MATVITAGNATNGLSLSADNTGAFEFKTGTGAGTTAISISSSQVVTMNGGAVYPLTSGTSVSASGTSVSFTDIPSWVKRITVMFNGVSTNGTSDYLIQIGSGSVTTSGYLGGSYNSGGTNYTTGFGIRVGTASAVNQGAISILLLGSNIYVASGVVSRSDTAVAASTGGQVTLSGTLDRVRITTVNGTDTFDAGTINILYE